MNCEACGHLVKQTLSDRCVSRIGRYKPVAYYCGTCDKIFILPQYQDRINPHQYDEELSWLRAQNPTLSR